MNSPPPPDFSPPETQAPWRRIAGSGVGSAISWPFLRLVRLGLAAMLLVALAVSTAAPLQAQTAVDICTRTQEVQDAILGAVSGTPTCSTITTEQLTGITELNITGYSAATLVPGDFAGLTGLQILRLKDSPDLTTLPADAFASFTQTIRQIDLGGNGIETVHSDAFQDASSLTVLILEDNRITTLDADTFDGLTDLQALRLRWNGITSLDADIFDGLESLTQLFLSGNRIGKLDADIFDGFTNLTVLDLTRNDIKVLEDGLFEDLASIQQMTIDSNLISRIEPSTFAGLSNLSFLNLSNNHIETLEAGTFDGLTAMSVLRIEGNEITALDGDTFDGLTGLSELNISNNKIKVLDGDAFDGLTAMSILRIGGNEITSVDGDTFDGLTGLSQVNISNNEITALDGDTFDGLTSLGLLLIHGNRIETLDEDVFDGLTNLWGLAIGLNNLTTLPADLFEPLDDSLRLLFLNDNSITSLEEDIFEGLDGLQGLSFSNNSLESLPADLFEPLDDSLRQLFLHENSITSLDEDIFDGLTDLQWLHLGGNELESLPADLFEPLDDSLRQLSLADNSVGALPADIFDGLTGLQGLDLSCNALTALELAGFDPFAPTLTFLDISGNRFTSEPTDDAITEKLTHSDLRHFTGANTDCHLPTNRQATFSISNPIEPGGFEVSENVTETTITVMLADPRARIHLNTIYGSLYDKDPDTEGYQVDLTHSINEFRFYVFSANDADFSSYLVSVVRKNQPASEARLYDLELSGLVLAPVFDKDTYSYTISAPQHTEQTTVTPTLFDPDATAVIKLDSVEDTDGAVDLKVGANTITVEVTAEDGIATKTYTVTITITEAQPPPPPPPPSITSPGSPTIQSVTPGDQTLTVIWTAPESDGGAAITAYDLRHVQSDAADKSDANWTVEANVWTSGSGILEYTITRLTNGTQYDVQVRAVNSEGDGSWSATMAGLTEPADPCVTPLDAEHLDFGSNPDRFLDL